MILNKKIKYLDICVGCKMAEDKGIHAGHRERLKNRAVSEGIEGFEPHQVLELLLFFGVPQRDTNHTAHLLMQKFGSFSAVLDGKREDLFEVNGMTNNAATLLSLLPSVFKYYKKDKLSQTKTIQCFGDMLNYFEPLLKNSSREEMYLMCLDASNNVIYSKVISKGSVNRTDISIRAILDIAMRINASRIIVSHSHPSGVASPSKSDDDFTRSLYVAMAFADIYLLDHLIIGKDDFYSYNRNGKINEYRSEYGKVASKVLAQDVNWDE